LNWILPIGAVLQLEGLSRELRILEGVGGGSQGQVYAVELGGERLALKWYWPACIARDPNLRRRLEESIQASSPNNAFLWPIALVGTNAASREQIRLREPSFGYLMPLRPPSFLGANAHAGGQMEISLQNVLRAAFFLADAFHALHLRGLCYKDISLGNLFLEPGSGRILICDNDNVAVDGRDPGSVLGTPGFMAPEILLGQARPGASSDLFSLAVLIFRLLTRHDPLKGALEQAIRCLDEPARRRLYGEDPVFIFDPIDTRNRPDPIEHAAALITWPIYPEPLQQLFLQTFVPGLKQPSRRALTGQWTAALAASLDRRLLCPSCGQEAFPEAGRTAGCWSCGNPLPQGPWLRLPRGLVAIAAGNEIQAHHLDRLLPLALDQPLARITAHPSDPSLLGLCNLTDSPWEVELEHGRRMVVEPGRSCSLAALRRVNSRAGVIERVTSHDLEANGLDTNGRAANR
jgi:serine/threonine protein kinase